MNADSVVVLVTTPSDEVARLIAHRLLDEKLAACVNILPPVKSLYMWEEKIHEDIEVLMIIKTRSDLIDDHLIPTIKSLHPYDVPEIIALPIVKGLDSYLNWIQDVVK